MSAISESSFEWSADDGRPIFVYSWLPAEPCRAVVQMVHGMAEHAERYAPLARTLAERGFAVYGSDHRGHGRSLQPGEEPGHMADRDGFDRAVRDVHGLNQHLATVQPERPRFLFGHSMGSFIVQRILWQHPDDCAAAALSGSNGRPPPIATLGRGVARLERLRHGRRGKSSLLNALSFGDFNKKFRPNRTDFDWLSRAEAEVDKYLADPLCGFMVSTQAWVDLLDAMPALTEPQNLAKIRKDLPIYILSGACDPVGDMGAGVRRLVEAYRAAWLSDVEITLYEEGRHEMLNETNREQVVADLIAWFERALEKI